MAATLDILIRARDEASRVIRGVAAVGEQAAVALREGLGTAGSAGSAAAKEVSTAWEQASLAVAGSGEQLSASVIGASEAAGAAGAGAAGEVSAAWKTVGTGAGAGLAAGVEASSATAAVAGTAAAEEVAGAWTASSRTVATAEERAAAATVASAEKAAAAQVGAAEKSAGAWAGIKGNLLGIAGTAGIAAFGVNMLVEQADEAQTVAAQTDAVIRSTGGAAGVTAEHVSDLATRLSEVAAVDDELVAQGENVLLTFTGVRNEVGKGNDIFDQATAAALDLSAGMGTDLQGAIVQVGKALNDPIKGVTALTRVGVSFTAQQKEQITTLVESGRTLEAQKIILGELQREFAGDAAANATSSDRMKVAFGNIEEELGNALLPVLGVLADVLKTLQPLIDLVAKHAGILLTAFLGYKSITFVSGVLTGISKAVVGMNLAEGASKAERLGQALAGMGGKARAAAGSILSFVKGIPTGVATLGTLGLAVAALVIGMGELSATSKEVEAAQRAARKELEETGAATEAYQGQVEALNEELANTSFGHEFVQGLASAVTGAETSAEQIADSLNEIQIAEQEHTASLAESLGQTLGLSEKTAAAVGNFFDDSGRSAELVRGQLTGLTAALAASSGASDEAKASFAELLAQFISVTGGLEDLDSEEVQHLLAEGKLTQATALVNEAFDKYFGTLDRGTGSVADAARALDEFNDFFGTTLDLTKGAKAATDEARKAYDAWAQDAADQLNFVSGAFSELAQKEGQSVEGLERGLDQSLEQMQVFGENLATIARDGGKGAQELVRQLLALGPAGADMAQKLVDAGKKGRAGIEGDLGAGLRFAQTEAQQLEKALTGGFDRIAAAILIATGQATDFDDAMRKLAGKHFHTSWTLTTHYEAIGSPPPDSPAGQHAPQIEAATGFHGIVSGPTRFLVGEGGRPERVDIGPAGPGGGGAGSARLAVAVNIDRRRFVDQQDYELRFGGPG